jgi:DNA polymerase III subunit delta
VKLPPARVEAFLRAPDPKLRAILVYGPDAGLVRERADRLARGVVPDPRDAFRVADIAAAALAGDPARLNDEAQALSLAGGRRLVRVRDAGDGAGALFAAFLKAPPPGDSLVLVEAGDLAGRSVLRRAFEGAAHAAAVPCYADGPRELEALVRDVLSGRRIDVAADAMAYLVASLGGDRGASRQELEKLALYAGDGGKVDLPAAMSCVGDGAALDLDDIVFAAAEGDAAGVERALQRAFAEGDSPVSIVRAAMRHMQRLHVARARLDAGSGEEAVLASLRPPLFYKLQDRFKRQLRAWPAARAAAVLEQLLEAEITMKRSGPPPETLCRKALLDVARRAGQRERSR